MSKDEDKTTAQWNVERLIERRREPMPKLEDLPDLSEWAHVEILTLKQAVCLYAAIDPNDFEKATSTGNDFNKLSDYGYSSYQVKKIAPMLQALISSIVLGTLPTFRIVAHDDGWNNNQGYEISPSDIKPEHLNLIDITETLLLSSAFRAWLNRTNKKTVRKTAEEHAKLKPHNKTEHSVTNTPLLSFDPKDNKYPLELHAATEAYKHVSQQELNRKKPKAVIRTFLDVSFGELSNEAKERIATVANYDKKGGATKQ